MCHAINGGKMPNSEWLNAIPQIPPTNYDELLLHLKEKGYNAFIYRNGVTQPDNKNINKLSVYCSPILMTQEVDKLQKICGKRFKVSALPNLQEIFISIKTN